MINYFDHDFASRPQIDKILQKGSDIDIFLSLRVRHSSEGVQKIGSQYRSMKIFFGEQKTTQTHTYFSKIRTNLEYFL